MTEMSRDDSASKSKKKKKIRLDMSDRKKFRHSSPLNGVKFLPIDSVKDKLIAAVKTHKTTIVVGETGSGKSTRLPSYLEIALNDGDDRKLKKVVCTQPRRVAAITIAERVANERRCNVGGDVGYTVRFDDKSGPYTSVKYVTDGILLRESMNDPTLSNYDVVILDEAHERSLQTDVVMGILKQLQSKRNDLRVVVMSATIEVESFLSYFEDVTTVHVPGRMYPVDVLYTREREEDYKEATKLTCLHIHENEEPGGVLVFLPGQEDIEDLQQLLEDELRDVVPKVRPDGHLLDPNMEDFIIFPLFAKMPPDEQRAAFQPAPAGVRKFILSTNMAETSLTISGIKYVVDPGFQKMKTISSHTGTEILKQTAISQSQAKQRAGRAGRESAGKCFRLYTEITYESLAVQSTPEIERVHLGQVYLQLLFQKVPNPSKFPFLSKPTQDVSRLALEQLVKLKAITTGAKREIVLTAHGRNMAQLPLSPIFANLLLKSVEFYCVDEMLTAVSMLSTDNSIFVQPYTEEKKNARNRAMRNFNSPEGDFLTLVSIYREWEKEVGYTNGSALGWCKAHYLNCKALQRARHVRRQLCEIFEKNLHLDTSVRCTPRKEPFLRCLASGLHMNLARRVDRTLSATDTLRGIGMQAKGTAFKIESSNEEVYVHPSSALFAVIQEQTMRQKTRKSRGKDRHDVSLSKIEYCVFTDVMETTKKYMKNVVVIDKDWAQPDATP